MAALFIVHTSSCRFHRVLSVLVWSAILGQCGSPTDFCGLMLIKLATSLSWTKYKTKFKNPAAFPRRRLQAQSFRHQCFLCSRFVRVSFSRTCGTPPLFCASSGCVSRHAFRRRKPPHFSLLSILLLNSLKLFRVTWFVLVSTSVHRQLYLV